VQCLYCETELKPFRGLFDEDFCCREHRDKYHSSFRKGLTRLPPDEIPEAVSTFKPSVAVLEELVSPVCPDPEPADSEPADPSTADFLPMAVEPATAVESYRTAGHDFFGDLLAIRIPRADRSWSTALEAGEWPAELAGPVETAAAASAPEPLPLAPPPFTPDVFPVHNVIGIPRTEASWTTAFEMEQRPAELAGPVEITAAAATVEPLPFVVAYSVLEIPRAETSWTTALEIEQRPIDLAEPVEIAAAAAIVEPLLFSVTAVPPVLEAGFGAVLLDAAGSFADHDIPAMPAEAFLSGTLEPLEPASVPLEMPSFAASDAGATSALLADPAELALLCRQLISTPEPVSAVELPCEFTAPEFMASRENMRCDDVGEFALEPRQHAVESADPEIAPPLAVNSAPLASASSRPASASAMLRPALELASGNSKAQLSVPAHSAGPETEPSLAPELMAGIPHQEAANPAAGPHSHAELQPAFWSSVRIKNWRLRITFAKPA
jgi:hypothetical protein